MLRTHLFIYQLRYIIWKNLAVVQLDTEGKENICWKLNLKREKEYNVDPPTSNRFL